MKNRGLNSYCKYNGLCFSTGKNSIELNLSCFLLLNKKLYLRKYNVEITKKNSFS